MAKLVECVPNFSEGQHPEVVKAIVDAAGGVPGVKVLDFSSDPAHNRTVLTFIGEPQAVKRAAFAS
ncbi:MAG: glutamate formiminotransferase, partial [Synergistaceae bacterium]|nr:glutamate formiminotransferase [Synergistaceae bacterium]